MEALAFISALGAIVVTIIWIVIGWRAMRAHERIADVASEWIAQQREERRVATATTTPKSSLPQNPNFHRSQPPNKPTK